MQTVSSHVHLSVTDLNKFPAVIKTSELTCCRSITNSKSIMYRSDHHNDDTKRHKAKVNTKSALSSLKKAIGVFKKERSFLTAAFRDKTCAAWLVCCCDDAPRSDLLLFETADRFNLQQRRFTAVKAKLLNQDPPPCFLPQQLTLSSVLLLRLLQHCYVFKWIKESVSSFSQIVYFCPRPT